MTAVYTVAFACKKNKGQIMALMRCRRRFVFNFGRYVIGSWICGGIASEHGFADVLYSCCKSFGQSHGCYCTGACHSLKMSSNLIV